MCNFGNGGSCGNIWWIIILLLLFCCCGNGNNGCDNDRNCGCC